jgi:hypothetical protein
MDAIMGTAYSVTCHLGQGAFSISQTWILRLGLHDPSKY